MKTFELLLVFVLKVKWFSGRCVFRARRGKVRELVSHKRESRLVDVFERGSTPCLRCNGIGVNVNMVFIKKYLYFSSTIHSFSNENLYSTPAIRSTH